MTYKQKQQTERNIFEQQQNHTRGKTPHGGVGQDKRAASSARTALRQASRSAAFPRAQSMRKEVVRAPLVITGRRKKEKITVWVEPVVKTELERRAKRNGLSLSATGGELLTQALQANIDMQYGALLEPIIRHEIRRQMQTYSSRIALLLVRVAFAAEQTRNLVTNILARQPGVAPDLLNKLLDSSANSAKSKITAKTPQLERIINEVRGGLGTRQTRRRRHEEARRVSGNYQGKLHQE